MFSSYLWMLTSRARPGCSFRTGILKQDKIMTSYESWDILNHQQLDCLFHRPFVISNTSKKRHSFVLLTFWGELSVDSPYVRLAIRKWFRVMASFRLTHWGLEKSPTTSRRHIQMHFSWTTISTPELLTVLGHGKIIDNRVWGWSCNANTFYTRLKTIRGILRLQGITPNERRHR